MRLLELCKTKDEFRLVMQVLIAGEARGEDPDSDEACESIKRLLELYRSLL